MKPGTCKNMPVRSDSQHPSMAIDDIGTFKVSVAATGLRPPLFHFPQSRSAKTGIDHDATKFSHRRLTSSNYLDLDFKTEISRDVRRGLSLPQKAIPSKYFYDDHGSRLFDRICCLPEYYPTRCEIALLEKLAPAIMSFFDREPADLVEIGCGSDTKVRKLLHGIDEALLENVRYVPVDISGECLIRSAVRLLRDFHALRIHTITADFTRHLTHLPRRRKLIVFLGGTLGNFTATMTRRLLGTFAAVMNSDDRLLIGIDMLKPVTLLERAYNDRAGITAAFNLNILDHLNRRLGGNFNTTDFDHRAFFNHDQERIEMHLAAKRDVEIYITDLDMLVRIDKGETIHTEISQKYSRHGAEKMFVAAGLLPVAWHTDDRGRFSLVELRKIETV